MRRIRTGVVGFGLAGRVFHAPYVQAIPELELAVIVQRTGNTGKEAYPDVAQMRSLEELLESDVELVVIGTPSPTHYALTKQALLAGKHVVCDKPMTTTLEQAEELEHIAKVQGKLLFPFHNRRWDGDFLTLQRIIEDGQLGRIVTLDSRFDRYRPELRAGAWREEQDGGGLLFDLSPHLIDQALVLFGHPSTLTASVRHDRNVGRVTDAWDIQLNFIGPQGRNILVRLGSTTLAADPAPRYRLHGTRGSYVKYGVDPQEPSIVAGAKVPTLGSNEPWFAEPESEWGTLTVAPDPTQPANLQRSKVRTLPGDYRNYYRNVALSILGQAEPAVTPRAAIRVARLIELAHESQRTGTSITVDRTGW